jgi:Nif11 domain
MSIQGVTAFGERLESDEQFRRRVEQAGTPQEKRQVLVAVGLDVGPDHLSTLRSLAGITDISDEDLEKVAGGTGSETGFMASIVSVGGVTVAAAAAALV